MPEIAPPFPFDVLQLVNVVLEREISAADEANSRTDPLPEHRVISETFTPLMLMEIGEERRGCCGRGHVDRERMEDYKPLRSDCHECITILVGDDD